MPGAQGAARTTCKGAARSSEEHWGVIRSLLSAPNSLLRSNMFAHSTVLDLTAPSVTAVSSPPLPPLPTLSPAVEYGKAVKQHQCPSCDQSFPRAYNLARHIANLHTNASKEECGLCGQHFKPGAMVKHAKDCQGLTTAPTAPSPPKPTADAAPPAVDMPLSPSSLPVEPTVSSTPVESTSSTPVAERPSLASNVIDGAAADFMKWLQEPALPTEHMVRKVATVSAIQQMREGVRQVVREVDREMPRLFAGGVQLRLLVVPDVVTALMNAMQGRGVQASTMYPVALLLKKVCVWLCSRQSRATKQYIAPDTLPGWPLICHWCSLTTEKRKRDHLSRGVRGKDEHKWMKSHEKNQLLSACLAKLHEVQQTATESNWGVSWTDFTDNLVVALLMLGVAPRQGTFRALTVDMVLPPGSDSRTPEQYVIDGEHAKTKMPYYCAVHPVLTGSMRFYLERVLGAGYSGPLFLQMGGKARQDFSLTTRKVTKQYLGRCINASKFRQTVVTDLRGKPGINGKSLANIMGHDERTAQLWYLGTDMARDARLFQDTLLEGVVVPAGMM